MTGQDVIRFLFLLNLQYRKHKQVTPGPTAPTSPRLLFKQLYYGSSKSVIPSVTLLCVQQEQLVMPASTSPVILLAKKLYYGSTRCDSPSASCLIA